LYHQEAAPERDVVRARNERDDVCGRSERIGRTVEELRGRAVDPLRPGRDGDRHNAAVGRTVEQLPAVARPEWLRAAADRDGRWRALDVRKRADIHLIMTAAIRLVGKPPAVWRNLGVDLLVRTREQGLLIRDVHRERAWWAIRDIDHHQVRIARSGP